MRHYKEAVGGNCNEITWNSHCECRSWLKIKKGIKLDKARLYISNLQKVISFYPAKKAVSANSAV